MKKLLIIGSCLALLASIFVVIPTAKATSPYPSDIYGTPLREGDVISANQTDGDPDIYIIKLMPDSYNGFKRLFLNPVIFTMYGHLGGFANVRQVTPEVRDSFVTSGLFRNCETYDQKVWATEVTSEDVGVFHHVQMSGDRAVAQDYRFFDKVFCINTREENFYAKSIYPYYNLSDIPRYFRIACHPRPQCLDQTPRCYLSEPIGGWCSSPDCYWQQVQCFRAPCYPIHVCPTPTPVVTPAQGSPVTVQSVTVEPIALSGYSTLYHAKISGYVPTPCYTVSSVVSLAANRFDISVTAVNTLAPGSACAQVIQNFSIAQSLSVPRLSTGTFQVYVNGIYWTQFDYPNPVF